MKLRKYGEYIEGDIFIWRVRSKPNNPLQVGYLYFDKEDSEWYVGDRDAYPSASGFIPEYVFEHGIKVSSISDYKKARYPK